MTRATWRSTVAVLFACTAAWAASPALAQEASMLVRDAVTGELRAPTPEEARAMVPRAAAAKPTDKSTGAKTSAESGEAAAPAAPRSWTLPDGTVISETTEEMMSATVVVRDADGKLVEHCVENEAAAKRLLKSKPIAESTSTPEHADAHK